MGDEIPKALNAPGPRHVSARAGTPEEAGFLLRRMSDARTGPQLPSINLHLQP
jgi:hypothetical protein